MKNASVAELFEKATSRDEPLHAEFASRIPEVLGAFQPGWVEKHLLPFLVTWVPRNNARVLLCLVGSIPQILAAASSPASVAPLLEAILASDNTQVAFELFQTLAHKSNGCPMADVVKAIMESRYDCVRKFAVRFLAELPPGEERRGLARTLAHDASFDVRLAVCLAIADFDDELAPSVVHALVGDRSARLRATLVGVCVQRAWFVSSVARVLASDADWSVRAAVAMNVGMCKDAEKGAAVAKRLSSDGVIQVRLCALRSLARLVPACDGKMVEDVRKVIKEAMGLQYASLKKAAIDCFMAIAGNGPEDKAFVDAVLADENTNVKLRFLKRLVKSPELVAMVGNGIFDLVNQVAVATDWRERAELAELFAALGELTDRKDKFCALCVQMFDDDTRPVVSAAAQQLVMMTANVLVNGTLPSYLIEMCTSDSYRKRQTAVMIMFLLCQRANEGEKSVLTTEMRRFLSDPSPNVVALTQDMLSSLSQ